MENCPYCSKSFKSWKSVRGHTSACIKSNGSYYIHLDYGPIHYSKILEYKGRFSIKNALKGFRKRGFNFPNQQKIWNKDKIIKAIKSFYEQYNRIPQQKDFYNTYSYPAHRTCQEYFGSFNAAIEAAGFTPNDNSGFGIATYGKDGHLYRSRIEADFANEHLFGKYEYEIEPSYPEPHSDWLYDWYIPELDLYIELDGGLRPQRIEEKIQFNQELGRDLEIF